MKFNEDSRVKIPTLIHLERLGYAYISLKKSIWDIKSNIFDQIFIESFSKINNEKNSDNAKKVLDDLKLSLSNKDLGKDFYNKLTNISEYKIIDFDNIENNSFHTVTELTYKNDDEEFRPDISVLINGLPLVFIEVKKPNNKEGIYSERNRIDKRFKNPKFKDFFNLTQFIIFSNNMDYDDLNNSLLQGAFYAPSSYNTPKFNYFREEGNFLENLQLKSIGIEKELEILKDNNLLSIKDSPEFQVNKKPDTPTNKICSSLLSKERLLFLLKYGFAYVQNDKNYEKHILRYPQLFAVKAIEKAFEAKINKGVIWHTQGSGKTALSYYSTRYFKDYFSKKKINAKFYFIVDRIDLLEQASLEFKKRGLFVHIINTKEEFRENIKSKKIIHNDFGYEEIILVNIQRFENDLNVIEQNGYNLDIQRIYFLDEVHRSYDPKGSFLANLHLSDPNAIKIGLTGTPLLGKDKKTRDIFGGYIHKYFYNQSIRDGYTLRLIREEISNQYRRKAKEIISDLELPKGKISSKQLFSKKKFVEPMLEYIIQDYIKSQIGYDDQSIGAMVICDSYEQAEMMFNLFNKKTIKDIKEKNLKAALILYDTGTKEDRKKSIEEFKDGKKDILFVYNMLLTGFDSPRLKKLYFARKIRAHSLLQALTRVNRPYKNFKFGYVVDFADIHEEFKKTNQAYFDELKLEFGDEIQGYENLFKSEEEIQNNISKINELLSIYDIENLENFSRQISEIENKKVLTDLLNTLSETKELYNIIKLSGKIGKIKNFDFSKIGYLFNEVANRINLISQKEIIDNDIDGNAILNLALEDIVFNFIKIKTEELKMSDELRDALRKTRENLRKNFDPSDPTFVSFREELERLFKKKKLEDITSEEMKENIEQLNSIFDKSKELNRLNELIKSKYENDEKYARIHKKLIKIDNFSKSEAKLILALNKLKSETDKKILQNSNLLKNESYIKTMITRITIDQFKSLGDFDLNLKNTNLISNMVSSEYLNEYNNKFQ
jgi:type I restriction enzyme R subunit